MSASNPTVREFAAVAYALGVARGALHSALQGSANARELKQILDGTSAASIASAIGQSESDLTVDWNDHLSEDEKRAITGAP
jgi:hypothetical protein